MKHHAVYPATPSRRMSPSITLMLVRADMEQVLCDKLSISRGNPDSVIYID